MTFAHVDLGPGIGAAFTDRRGGESREPYDSLNLGGAVGDDPAVVAENRYDAARELGLDPARVVFLRQVHGAHVIVAAEPAGAEPPEADAVLTRTRGLALAVLVADCAPVLIADAAAGVAGAAHAGRPGTAAGVVPALVEAMRRHGAQPGRMAAALGPAVCGACYEVPAALRDEVSAVVPETYATTRAGTPGLDIRAGIAAQLQRTGVRTISTDPRCTMESPDLYSYRRDGLTGRFAGYVWIHEP